MRFIQYIGVLLLGFPVLMIAGSELQIDNMTGYTLRVTPSRPVQGVAESMTIDPQEHYQAYELDICVLDACVERLRFEFKKGGSFKKGSEIKEDLVGEFYIADDGHAYVNIPSESAGLGESRFDKYKIAVEPLRDDRIEARQSTTR